MQRTDDVHGATTGRLRNKVSTSDLFATCRRGARNCRGAAALHAREE
jgi:hypothetical protein